ncbi:unnamed protein product [Arabis nemorensis]|uniref:NYN domain-containing protein n=1 Tax=Arabis nemorensis TaxID=586526 RepID=A0A565CLV1_9BRAS|nr:unnamed protein product [Arabis nemorensis]
MRRSFRKQILHRLGKKYAVAEIRGQLSIAGQISLDIVRFAQGLYPLRTAFVVISKHIPEIEETKRVLRCLQTRYQHPVLIVDPTAHGDERWILVKEPSTGVFWDAKDCPFPAGWSADTIYTKIRSAFTEAYCVSGNMPISSYADEMNNESWNKPPESESRINHLILAGDKPARLERMLNDMLLWLIHNPHPSDLIVVADNIRDEIFEMLKSYVIRGHNVFIVTPSKDTGPERHDWPGSLLDQSRDREEERYQESSLATCHAHLRSGCDLDGLKASSGSATSISSKFVLRNMVTRFKEATQQPF